MSQKIWQKENTTSSELGCLVEKFTVGNDPVWDLRLAKYDVRGSLAHSQMLMETGLITSEEFVQIESVLQNILLEIEQGIFSLDTGVEDIHSQIEFLLVQRIGEAGKKIHTARSRNDQVLLDIKLYLKDEIRETVLLTDTLFQRFISLGERHKNDLMPGYTHFQLAMVSSFGMWFSAYAESLTDDLEVLLAAYALCNKNPLGSGAGFGSSFPINRYKTTELLGFSSMDINSLYAQTSRGKTEKILAFAIASIASTLSKFSYDACLYMNQQFGFISFPDELTTGSSIMPHKKNPDVFELIRAKCNVIQALPNELTLLTNNLPSGYHRDWQLTKERLFPALDSLQDCLKMLGIMLQQVKIRTNILSDEKYDALFSVEEVNKLVLQGIPFREAYILIAQQIAEGTFHPDKKIDHSHEGSLGNLGLGALQKRFSNLQKQFC